MARFVAVVAPLFVLCTFAASAAAGNPVAAQALFEEGRVLMQRGEFAAACAKFEGSQSLDPGPGTEYNLALCYEKSGRIASAWATYLSAATSYKATQRPEWESKARERASALTSSLSKLTVVISPATPPSVRITRDGTELVASELGAAIPVDPGRHSIEATASGHPTFREQVDLRPGMSKTVTVTLSAGSQVEAKHDGALGAPRQEPPQHESSAQRTLGWVVGGVGAVGLAVGAIGGLVAIGDNATSTKDCPNDGPCASAPALRANASARDWATVSTVGFVAGAALMATGLTLVLTAPTNASTARLKVAPAIGLGTAGVTGAW